jgi:hypothetical protein
MAVAASCPAAATAGNVAFVQTDLSIKTEFYITWQARGAGVAEGPFDDDRAAARRLASIPDARDTGGVIPVPMGPGATGIDCVEGLD